MNFVKRVRKVAEDTVQRATEALEGDGPPIVRDDGMPSSNSTPQAATPSRAGAPTGKVVVDEVRLKRATREEMFAVVQQVLFERGISRMTVFRFANLYNVVATCIARCESGLLLTNGIFIDVYLRCLLRNDNS